MLRRVVPLVTALALAPAAARAACAPATDAEVVARIAEVEGILAEHGPNLNLWYTGFTSLHFVTIATSATLYSVFEDPNLRKQAALTSGLAGLGALSLSFVAPPVLEARRELGPLPRDTPAARRAYLAAAEALLDRQRRRSRFATSWIARGLSLAAVVGSSLTVWLAFDRPLGGLQQLLGGLAVGQGQIILHPTGAADAYDAYEARHGCGAPPRAAPPATTWQLTPAPGGLGVQLRF